MTSVDEMFEFLSGFYGPGARLSRMVNLDVFVVEALDSLNGWTRYEIGTDDVLAMMAGVQAANAADGGSVPGRSDEPYVLTCAAWNFYGPDAGPPLDPAIRLAALMDRYEAAQGDDFNAWLSADERAECSAEWSRQLRGRVAASRERERHQVVVDLDWELT